MVENCFCVMCLVMSKSNGNTKGAIVRFLSSIISGGMTFCCMMRGVKLGNNVKKPLKKLALVDSSFSIKVPRKAIERMLMSL